jgi:hypothetical protein
LSFVISLAAGCTQGLLMIVNFFTRSCIPFGHTCIQNSISPNQSERAAEKSEKLLLARRRIKGNCHGFCLKTGKLMATRYHLKALTANTVYRLSASQSDFQPLLA